MTVSRCSAKQSSMKLGAIALVTCIGTAMPGISCDLPRITRELLLLCEPVADVMVYRGRVVSEGEGAGIAGLQLGLTVFVDGEVYTDAPRHLLAAATDVDGEFAFALTESASACDDPPMYPVPDRLVFTVGCTEIDTPIEREFEVSAEDITDTEYRGVLFDTIDVGTIAFPGCEE